MSNYGSRKSYEERRASKKARIAHHKQVRAGEPKKTKEKTKKLLSRLRYYMDKAGLTKTALSDFSGVDPATIIRIKNRRHPNIRLNTFLAVANACGYEIQFVKKQPKDDEFRSHRLVRLTDLDGKG